MLYPLYSSGDPKAVGELMSNIQRLGKSALWVLVISVFTKILALLREILIAKYFGASDAADSYFMAYSILGMFCLISHAMHGSLVPMFINVRGRGKREEKHYVERLLTGVIVALAIVSLIVFVLSPQLVSFFARGFVGEKKTLTIMLLRTGATFILLSGIYDLFGNYLISVERFIPESIAGLMLNIAYLGYFLLMPGKWLTVQSLMGMVVVAMLIKGIVLWICSRQNLGAIHLRNGILQDSDIQETLRLAGPILLGSMTYYVNGMVDKFIASGLSPGKISAMNYASKVTGMLTTLLVSITITIVFPSIVKISLADDEWLKLSVRKGLSFLLYLILPLVTGIIVLRLPIIELLYQRGEFTSSSTDLTVPALALYAIIILTYVLSEFLLKIFYAKQNMFLPMYIGIASVALNIVLDFVFVVKYDYLGLIAATIAASVFRLVAYAIALYRFYEIDLGKGTVVSVIKSFMAALCMGTVVFYFNRLLIVISVLQGSALARVFGLLIAIILGAVVYLVMLAVLRVEELSLIKAYLRRSKD
jgi:putative peptidoglycan lipid II flippase